MDGYNYHRVFSKRNCIEGGKCNLWCPGMFITIMHAFLQNLCAYVCVHMFACKCERIQGSRCLVRICNIGYCITVGKDSGQWRRYLWGIGARAPRVLEILCILQLLPAYL